MEWVGALKAIPADTPAEDRDSLRYSLSLDTHASSRGRVDRVLVHNLSATGLLIETALQLRFGDEIELELPRVDAQRAKVVWSSEGLHGCQFVTPLSDATVSASRLRSMPLWRSDDDVEDYREPGLSIRAKVGIVTGLAAVCWAAIIAAVLVVA